MNKAASQRPCERCFQSKALFKQWGRAAPAAAAAAAVAALDQQLRGFRTSRAALKMLNVHVLLLLSFWF